MNKNQKRVRAHIRKTGESVNVPGPLYSRENRSSTPLKSAQLTGFVPRSIPALAALANK